MVMGSIFDTPTDEEDQNPPQPQPPPPQDPLAQQPLNVQPQSAPAFQQGPQSLPPGWSPAELAAQGQAQSTRNQAQAVANQAGGGALDWYNQNVHNPIQQQVDQNTRPGLMGQLQGLGSGFNYALSAPGRALNNVLPAGTPDIVRDVGTNAANLLPWSAAALASGGGSVIPTLAALGGSAVGGVLAPAGANLLEQQGGIPGAIGQGLNTQIVPPWVPVFGGATPAGAIGMIGGGGVGDALGGGLSRPVSDPLAPRSEPTQAPPIPDQPVPAPNPIVAPAPIETPVASVPQSESTVGQPGPSSQEFKDAITRARVAGDFSGLEALAPTYTPEEVRAYFAGYDLASVPGSNYGRPQYGPESVGNGPQDNPLSNAHWQGVFDAQAEKAASGQSLPGQPGGQPPLNEAGQINAGMDPRTPEQIAASSAAGSDAFGSLRSASPEAQAFQQSPAGQQFNGQRATGAQAGEASAPIDNNRGGRNYPPPPAGLNGNLWDNTMSLVGAPTQPLLLGLHTARFGPQEALRPGVLGNGLKALGETILSGHADAVIDHVNNDLGPNIPQGMRASDMKAQSGNPPVSQTYVNYAINHIPVIGNILSRLRDANSTFLGVMRDAHYNYAADRLARTVPDASPEMYQDLWREANNATGHSTLLPGSSTSQGMGIGWGAMMARVEELGNTIMGSGAPVPGLAAGSRAEAFKTLMGVASTMAATTALGKVLGANVNVNDPWNKVESYGMNSNFLRPVTNNGLFKTAYGTGGAGYDTLFRAAATMGHDLGKGNPEDAVKHGLAFARGEFGVVPGAVIDGILGKDWQDKPYSWRDFINEAKTGFMADKNGNLGQGRSVPIPAAANLQAIQAYGPEGALRAAPSDIASEARTSPINTASQAFQYVVTPDVLQKANLPQQARGLDWNEMLPTEKASVTNVLKQTNPELVQQIQNATRERTPAIAAHADTVDQLRQQKNSTEDHLLAQFNAHQLTGAQVRSAMKATNTDYFNAIQKSNQEPGYVKEVNDIKASGQNPTKAQNLLDQYYQITADDPKQAFALRNQFLASVIHDDPNIGERLLVATQSHQNESKLQQLYTSAEPVVSAVFSKEGADRAAERRAHPDEDALVNFLGYESRTLTPQAEQLLNEMRATQGNKH